MSGSKSSVGISSDECISQDDHDALLDYWRELRPYVLVTHWQELRKEALKYADSIVGHPFGGMHVQDLAMAFEIGYSRELQEDRVNDPTGKRFGLRVHRQLQAG